jgi:hypothetical protein
VVVGSKDWTHNPGPNCRLCISSWKSLLQVDAHLTPVCYPRFFSRHGIAPTLGYWVKSTVSAGFINLQLFKVVIGIIGPELN